MVPTFCELVLVPNCFEIDGHTVNTVHTVDFEALLVIGGDAPQSGVHVLPTFFSVSALDVLFLHCSAHDLSAAF